MNEYDEFFESIENKEDIDRITSMGDFNIPELQNFYDCDLQTNLTARFNSFLNFCDMKQCNEVRNHNNRMLDLVLTNK